ncbi:hypothetical protein CGZ80_02465 [Rhodopirellula sp. MGV]|nr:hypothetical protein CGZ80_02465 [Rhodopirellula sp. MGV]
MAMHIPSTLADESTSDESLSPPCLTGCGHSKKDHQPCRQCQPLPAGVFCEGGPIRFRLMQGRLEIDPMRYRKGSEEHQCERFQETISVSASSGIPAVYYSFHDSYQDIRLTAEYGGALRIESTILATGEQGELIQLPNGSIQFRTRRLTSTPSDLNESCQGTTLLHIVGQDEDGFNVHLESLLSRLLQGRSLIELTRETETYLRDNTHRLTTVSREHVDELVTQLRSSKSSHRRAAVRELTSFGSSAVPLLRASLSRHDLDTEQIARIQLILSNRARIDEDTSSSLAQLMAADRSYWQILAKRMNKNQWLIANDHVMRCGLESLSP